MAGRLRYAATLAAILLVGTPTAGRQRRLGLNHLIRRPREIYVQEGVKGVETIAVVCADGVKQILHLKDPLMLPAPQGHQR